MGLGSNHGVAVACPAQLKPSRSNPKHLSGPMEQKNGANRANSCNTKGGSAGEAKQDNVSQRWTSLFRRLFDRQGSALR
jgi:hypothetical protein